MDKVCQGMFFVELYDNWRAPPEALQLLMEFRSQSQRLQDEMAGDIERLQDHLTGADGEVDQVRSNLIALTRQAYDDREKYDLSTKTSEARIKELDRKLGVKDRDTRGGTPR